MGCFNDTCRWSGLPIRYGDECVVLHIIESHASGLNCIVYPWSIYHLIGVPYVAKYDDYGGYDVEDETQSGYIETFNLFMKYSEQNEGSSRGMGAVKLESFDYEMIKEAIGEGTLRIKQAMGPYKQVHLYPIHKDVYEKGLSLGSNLWSWRKNEDESLEAFKKAYAPFGLSFKATAEEAFENSRKHYEFENFIRQNYGFENQTRHHSMSIDRMVENMGVEATHKFMVEFKLLTNFMYATNKMFYPWMTSGQEEFYDKHLEFNTFVKDKNAHILYERKLEGLDE